MATLLNGQSPTFYVLGRSEARFASQRAKLESLNPSCKLIFKQAEFSLLANIDAVCKQIHEERVDILFMSPRLDSIEWTTICVSPLTFYCIIDKVTHRHQGRA